MWTFFWYYESTQGPDSNSGAHLRGPFLGQGPTCSKNPNILRTRGPEHTFGVFAQVGLIFGLIWAFFTIVTPFQPRHCSVVLPHVIVQDLLSNHSFATIFTCI